MSDLLIRGMKMPTSCRACQLKMNCDDCEGWECVCVPLRKQIGYLDDLLADKRRDDCPLVPVPPHGRLIDADAEIARVQNLYNKAVAKDPEMGCVSVYEGEIAVLKLAPTIIPAECLVDHNKTLGEDKT